MSETGRRRLTSWKEIGSHLGRDVRTVMRWEKERGLPVHRVPGATGRVIFADPDELDAWVRGDIRAPPPNEPESVAPALTESTAPIPAPPARAISRRLAIAAAVVIVLGLAAWWAGGRRSAADLAIRITDQGIVATAPDGAERWRHEFDRGEATIPIDLKHEQPGEPFGRDIVTGTAYATRKTDGVVLGGRLQRFAGNGQLLSTFAFDDVLQFDRPYGAPWVLTDFRVERASGSPRVVVAAHHAEWWPSAVTILDAQWKRRGTFVHAGWVERVQWLTSDRIVIAGFSNAQDAGMVALLDANALDGQSPAPHGSPFACGNCAHKGPLRYVVMPRSEVNTANGSPFNRVVLLVKEGALLARTIEAPPTVNAGAADVLYELTPSLDLVRASYSDRYWEMHRELEAAGKIDHTRGECPDRNGPPGIRVWDPSTGWAPVANARSPGPSAQARSRP